MKKKIVVVGGGFTGLTTAYYLRRQGWKVEIYERSKTVGGLLGSEQTSWGLVESAANGILNSPRVEDLCNDLKIEMVVPRKESRRRYLYRQGLKLWPLSWSESRKLLFHFLPRFLFWRRSLKPHPLETLAAWGERNMGIEATQYILAPALQGIYAGDSAKLSATLVLSRFLVRRKWFRGRRPRLRGTVSPVRGMGQLITRLKESLVEEGVVLHSATEFNWSIAQKGKVPVVICTSVDQAAVLLKSVAPQVSILLEKTEMLPLISVTVFYEKTPGDISGFGCLFPRSEGFDVLGVLFNDQIFSGRTEKRSETWIFGGSGKSNVCEWSDAFILSKIKMERMKIFARNQDPIGHSIHRWPKALPHYSIDLETALERLDRLPENVHLMGNYLGQIGLNQILDRAYEFAEAVSARDGGS